MKADAPQLRNPSTSSDEQVGRWVAHQAGLRTVRDLEQDLRAVGVKIVIFKGLHLSMLAADPLYRPMDDVDVVIEGDFDRALAQLGATARWLPGADESHSVPIIGPRGRTVDLHRSPLPLHFGALNAGRLADRSRPAPSFGPCVRVPDLVDAAVLVLAHFVKDRLGAYGTRYVARDLDVLLGAGAGYEAIATRCGEHGLRRVGLIAANAIASSAPRFRPLLDAFCASTLELRVANCYLVAAVRWAQRYPRLSWWTVRLLPDDLDAQVLGLMKQVRDSLYRRLQTVRVNAPFHRRADT